MVLSCTGPIRPGSPNRPAAPSRLPPGPPGPAHAHARPAKPAGPRSRTRPARAAFWGRSVRLSAERDPKRTQAAGRSQDPEKQGTRPPPAPLTLSAPRQPLFPTSRPRVLATPGHTPFPIRTPSARPSPQTWSVSCLQPSLWVRGLNSTPWTPSPDRGLHRLPPGAGTPRPPSRRSLPERLRVTHWRPCSRGEGDRALRVRASVHRQHFYSRCHGPTSQAEPAGDTPAPGVGAVLLPLVLQDLVPDVHVHRGALPLGKQVWEGEGLPERLGRETGLSAPHGRGPLLALSSRSALPGPRSSPCPRSPQSSRPGAGSEDGTAAGASLPPCPPREPA